MALVAASGLRGTVQRARSVDEAVALLAAAAPALVAVDCPCTPAADGELSRPDERAVARAVCGIRYTPDAATVHGPRPKGDDFYGWIKHGLALYAALEAAGLATVECFPTASWTRWGGPRASRGRGAWSGQVLASLAVPGVPGRLNQDERDAVGAALTARAVVLGDAELIGRIAVPHPALRGFSQRRAARRSDLS